MNDADTNRHEHILCINCVNVAARKSRVRNRTNDTIMPRPRSTCCHCGMKSFYMYHMGIGNVGELIFGRTVYCHRNKRLGLVVSHVHMRP